MARHRAPVATRVLRHLRSLVTPRAPHAVPDHVVLTEVPSQPHHVRLDYPDGSQLPASWRYAGHDAPDQERYIIRVPANATVVNGMVVRADRDLTLAVEIADRLSVLRRRHQGADE